MTTKYKIILVLALLVGYMSTTERGGGFRLLILSIGPLAIVGLLVADYYEKKKK